MAANFRSTALQVTSQFRTKVRTALMACIVRQDTAFFDIVPSGVLQERLNRDAEDLASKIFHLPLRFIHCRCRAVSSRVKLSRQT